MKLCNCFRIIFYATNIDLVKFANKFEAAYEIIRKWYKKETKSAFEWKEVDPVSSNVLFI